MILSNRILQISESQSMQMNARSAQLCAQGLDIINLSLGEPDFATPAHIKSAAKDAIDCDFSHYGSVSGMVSLREAIAKNWHFPIKYTAEDIIVSVGAKQCIYNVIQCLIDFNDEVIIPNPCWLSYSAIVKLAGGQLVEVKTNAEIGYKLTAEQLEQAITNRTKLLILCSPNNPTGSVYTSDEMRAIVDVLRQHPHVCVISDEIYASINYVGGVTSMAEFPEIANQLILVSGVSKAYAMTGYRIGWMACKNRELIAGCTKLQGQEITCATMVAQKAAEAAVSASQECIEQMRSVFEQRRDLLVKLVKEIPNISFVYPYGAFYLFANVSAYYGTKVEIDGKTYCVHNSTDMTNYLLEVAHVALVMGSAYGEDQCVRMSYATSETQIKEALKRIKETLSLLK